MRSCGAAKSPCSAIATTAPVISEDAAMLLVDEELEKRGSTAVSTRDDVRAAFAHLTSPLVRAARWLNEPGGAIVVIHP